MAAAQPPVVARNQLTRPPSGQGAAGSTAASCSRVLAASKGTPSCSNRASARRNACAAWRVRPAWAWTSPSARSQYGARSAFPVTRVDPETGAFLPTDQLRSLYEGQGLTPDKEVVAYCRIGERSAHTWFVLHELLGYPRVRNYDGSWTEWGSMVGVPIER